MDVSGRQTGTVTWFDNESKCGGIKPSNGGEEVLLLQDNVSSKLIMRKGLVVEYFADKDDTGGLVAFDVDVVADRGKKPDLPLFVDSGITVGGSGLVSGGRVCGMVNLFNKELGCGKIRPADGGEEVFVHQLKADVTLEEGMWVEYLVSPRKDGSGFEAVQVTLPSTHPESSFAFGGGGGNWYGGSGGSDFYGGSGGSDFYGGSGGSSFYDGSGIGGSTSYGGIGGSSAGGSGGVGEGDLYGGSIGCSGVGGSGGSYFYGGSFLGGSSACGSGGVGGSSFYDGSGVNSYGGIGGSSAGESSGVVGRDLYGGDVGNAREGGGTEIFGYWNGDEFVPVEGKESDFCYACCRSGHRAPYCTAVEQHGGGGGGCYNCGMRNHRVRDCPTLGNLCYRCLQGVHLPRDCPVTRYGGGGGAS